MTGLLVTLKAVLILIKAQSQYSRQKESAVQGENGCCLLGKNRNRNLDSNIDLKNTY